MPVKMGTHAGSGQARLDFAKIGQKRAYADKDDDDEMHDDDVPMPQQSRPRNGTNRKRVQIIESDSDYGEEIQYGEEIEESEYAGEF